MGFHATLGELYQFACGNHSPLNPEWVRIELLCRQLRDVKGVLCIQHYSLSHGALLL
jgi:hypothetical protein